MTWDGFVGRISLTAAGYATGIDLGTLEDIKKPLASPLDTMTFPSLPASEQETMDQGAVRQITITGSIGFSSEEELIAWQESIDDLIDGNQYWNNEERYLAIYKPDSFGTDRHLWYIRADTTLDQDSTSNAPILVIIESFDPSGKGGEVGSCDYILKCTQQKAYWA